MSQARKDTTGVKLEVNERFVYPVLVFFCFCLCLMKEKKKSYKKISSDHIFFSY